MAPNATPDTTAAGVHVRALERGLSVLLVFGDGRAALSLSEVARLAELDRASARRFLLTLVNMGYVHFDGRLFSLRPKVLDLGYAYLAGLGLPDVARPHLEVFAGKVGESTSVGVLADQDIVYVARVPGPQIMRIALAVGKRLPAWVTSMGRVLLAGLPDDELEEHLAKVEIEPYTEHTVRDMGALRAAIDEVRADGVAVVDEELEHSLRSMAVGILDQDGAPMASLNVSVHASRVSIETLRTDVLPQLRTTAEAIADDLRSARRRPDSPG